MEEYLEDRINKFDMNSKHKNIRDLYRGINYIRETTYQEEN